jgi:hypothetical protein
MHAAETTRDDHCPSPLDTARFTDKQVHLFKEVGTNAARSYCGLGERFGIWREYGQDVTCGACARYLREMPDA